MATMQMYCPSLKKNVEATITDGKRVASKGGSLRNIIYGEYEGKKCLPKTVKESVFAQHGFAAEFEQGHYGLMDIKNQKGDVVGSVGLENHGEKIPAEEVSVSVNGLNNDLKFVLNKRNKGSYNPYNAEAETFEAYDDPISDRQEYKITSLGGTIDSSMNRSEASDYIKKLQGRKSGTWKNAETFEAEYPKYRNYKGIFIEKTAKNRAKLVSDMWNMTATLYKPRKKGNWILQLTQSHPRLGDRYKTEVKNFTDGLNLYLKFSDLSPLRAETFEAESSPSSFDISWEDGQGVSSPSLPPEGIHFAEQGKNIKFCNGCNKRTNFEDTGMGMECNFCGFPEADLTFGAEDGECEVCFEKNDGTGNLTQCNRCDKQICLGDMDACSSICGECGTYCCDDCLFSNNTCANCNFEYRAEGDYHMNGESCEYCSEARELNAEGFCSECSRHAESFSSSSYENAFFTETVSEMAAEGISRNGKLALSLTALGIGVAMALGSDKVSSLLDKFNRK